MNVRTVTDRKLSLVIADFRMCRECHVVDRDEGRIRVGHLCGTCGQPGEGGMMYFELSALLLIDLMQEAFHTPALAQSGYTNASGDAHNVSVVLFFCTLREVLLNSLLSYICWAQSIPRPVYDRLLADSNTHALRQNNLLPSLTGKKWPALLKQEASSSQLDYVELNEFLLKAVEARNKFMHEGKRWGIDRTLAECCMDHIWPLLNLYVSLHNRYVHAVVHKKPSP